MMLHHWHLYHFSIIFHHRYDLKRSRILPYLEHIDIARSEEMERVLATEGGRAAMRASKKAFTTTEVEVQVMDDFKPSDADATNHTLPLESFGQVQQNIQQEVVIRDPLTCTVRALYWRTVEDFISISLVLYSILNDSFGSNLCVNIMNQHANNHP